MQNLLVCQKKVKEYKIDRAADDVNVIRCYIMNGKVQSFHDYHTALLATVKWNNSSIFSYPYPFKLEVHTTNPQQIE